MKYGLNRVMLVGNVDEVPKVSEKDGEAFVAIFPLATNEVWRDKEGEWSLTRFEDLLFLGRTNFLFSCQVYVGMSEFLLVIKNPSIQVPQGYRMDG